MDGDWLNSPEATDAIAAVEHQRWAHWQRYLHSQCRKNLDGSLTIPVDLVHRWERQIATEFDQLTEAEQDSDREQAAHYRAALQKLRSLAPGSTVEAGPT